MMKISSLACTNHISSAEQSYMTSDYRSVDSTDTEQNGETMRNLYHFHYTRKLFWRVLVSMIL